ncbi:hypothetical protein QYE76_071967 [Lolium multiflorum]|uniref:PB1-like domain-containing protein n=1 Tax=Lolium multiflorum TaxID=4521 RepID=A0AAD8QH69_LOLMU|nr:hypothetical protein QYE76_071964 [Lolium multiflorum]KAK1602245.1 hypothetical protein QYE76_071967 [Lolium multiflorum]
MMKAMEKKKEEEDEFFRMLKPKKELNETLGSTWENLAEKKDKREESESLVTIDDPDRFTVVFEHNGFFCGLKEHLEYIGGTVDFFDNCNTDTFSLLWLVDFLKQGGNEMTERTKFYWCVPGPNGLRTDVVVPIPRKYTAGGEETEQEKEIVDEEPLSSACLSSGEPQSEDEDDSDTDSDFYDSDYDAEDGDDDLFADNIDKDVNDHNECTYIVELEDDAGLDHDNLKLSNEQQKLLEYRFKEFNPEVDMATPVFKVGMLFSSMAEFRKALTAYGVNERVKIRKSRNEATRLDAHYLH